MKYSIVIEKPALKFLQKQPLAQRQRILQAIQGLPENGDIKPLAGYKNLFRLRVGTYRIIYTIEQNVLTVRVLNAGNRGDIYK